MSDSTSNAAGESEPITMLRVPTRLDYQITAGETQTRFLRAVAEGRITGTHFPGAGRTYVPPRSMCPTNSETGGELVELPDVGTLTTFCIINIPFEGQRLAPPYVAGAILLDGADLPIFHIVAGVSPDEVRMGMRVKAVWVDADQREPTLESIQYFEPTGEADTPYESYAEHL